MKTFYKLNPLQLGSGTVIPQGFIEYTIGQEPQEILDQRAKEALTRANGKIYAQISTLESTLLRPMRELLSSTVVDKTFAQNKVDDIEAQIETLRTQIVI